MDLEKEIRDAVIAAVAKAVEDEVKASEYRLGRKIREIAHSIPIEILREKGVGTMEDYFVVKVGQRDVIKAERS